MHNPTTTIPGFELLQYLGGGPLTQVYSARRYNSDEIVVVKFLRPEWENDPTACQLLRREAVAGLSVSHPHLVHVREANILHKPYFLVMDLLVGESLRDRLKRAYALDLRTAMWIGRQTAEAIAALHRIGFIHGDIKPENVCLVDAGTAILLDLGFAHRPGENDTLFAQGYVLGTANYLAPEMCGPHPTADLASDLFSFGVMLFEMLTGELPYPPGSPTETLARHREQPAARLSDYPGHWPAPLDELLAGLCARRPAQRPRIQYVVQQLMTLEIATLRTCA